MKRYARIRLNDQVAAVEQLSTLVPNQTSCRAPLQATGTCDHSAQQYTQQRGRETVQPGAMTEVIDLRRTKHLNGLFYWEKATKCDVVRPGTKSDPDGI